MRRSHLALIVAPVLALAACAENPDKRHAREPAPGAGGYRPTCTVQVNEGLDKATQSYQRFLDETPESALTPEAMRRLADLKIEKEYGILGDGKLADDAGCRAPPRRSMRALPTASRRHCRRRTATREDRRAAAAPRKSDRNRDADRFRTRARATRREAVRHSPRRDELSELPLPEGANRDLERAGPLRRSSSTTSCSRSTRPTRTATRCSTRRRARTTSWAAPTKP